MTFVQPSVWWGLRVSLAIVMLMTGLLLIPSLASGQYSAGPDFKPLADSDGEVVFNYSADVNDPADRCDDEHIPDLATRAFRDKDGRVQLILAHRSVENPGGDLGGTRRMLNSVGDLGALTNDLCTTKVLTSSKAHDPASNNNYEWLAAPYTLDGQTIWSLVYDEYQPWRDPSPVTLPDECVTNPAAGASGCHYSSYTLGKSTNMGDSYGVLAPNPFIAGIPYKYEPRVPLAPGQSVGYADTSNIAKGPDGRYYAMFLPRPYPRSGTPVQKPGTCVMRTATLDVPGSWVAWGDGPDAGIENGWEVQFADPYPTEPPNKAEHVCAPVTHLFPNGQPQPENPISMSESLTYNRHLGKYMVIGASTNNSPEEETGHPQASGDDWDFDLYYSLSTDLVNWERKRLLINVPHKFEGCTKEPGSATLYSSAIDHQSTTRNFETTGKKFYVYVTRFNDQSCGGGIDRDLVRIPIELDIEPVGDKHATLEDGLTDPDTGFDSTSLNGFDLRSGEAYEGDNYAQATWISSGEQPHGVLDVNWSRGSDVWYSAGFRIVSSNFSDPSQGHAGASIMQWTGATGSGTGGIYLRSDGQWELRRGAVPISEPFTLPENHWFQLAVHQRLNQASQAPPSPLNQVFVNGQLKGQSVADNMFTNEALVPRKVKFGLPVISGQPAGVYVDRAYVGRNHQPPVDAPPTPEIFSGQEGNTYNWLHWHASPGAVGYDLYKLGNTGSFVQVTPSPITSPTYLHWPLDNCSKHRYVVAAYDAQGRRSAFSEPLELMPRDPAAAPCPA